MLEHSQPFQIVNPKRRRVYVARRRLGTGGFGDVFAGDCAGRPVAIKVIRPTASFTADVVTWRRDLQAHLLCRHHPNIVRSLDHFVSREGFLILVTELASCNLHDLIRSRGCLDELEICWLGADIASALHHVHARRLIHRDVTPKNILWFQNWTFKLNDFGITKNCAGVGNGIARTVIGLPSFLPPELVTNRFSIVKSDIYQLGMVLLTALTGQYPIPLNVPRHEAHRMIRVGVPRQIAESLLPSFGPIAQLIAMMLRRSLDYRLSNSAQICAAFCQLGASIAGRAN